MIVCFALISPLWGDVGSCVLISLIPVMHLSPLVLFRLWALLRGQRAPNGSDHKSSQEGALGHCSYFAVSQ